MIKNYFSCNDSKINYRDDTSLSKSTILNLNTTITPLLSKKISEIDITSIISKKTNLLLVNNSNHIPSSKSIINPQMIEIKNKKDNVKAIQTDNIPKIVINSIEPVMVKKQENELIEDNIFCPYIKKEKLLNFNKKNNPLFSSIMTNIQEETESNLFNDENSEDIKNNTPQQSLIQLDLKTKDNVEDLSETRLRALNPSEAPNRSKINTIDKSKFENQNQEEEA